MGAQYCKCTKPLNYILQKVNFPWFVNDIAIKFLICYSSWLLFWHPLKFWVWRKCLPCLTLLQAPGVRLHCVYCRKPSEGLKQGMARCGFWAHGFAAMWRMVTSGQCHRQGLPLGGSYEIFIPNTRMWQRECVWMTGQEGDLMSMVGKKSGITLILWVDDLISLSTTDSGYMIWWLQGFF